MSTTIDGEEQNQTLDVSFFWKKSNIFIELNPFLDYFQSNFSSISKFFNDFGYRLPYLKRVTVPKTTRCVSFMSIYRKIDRDSTQIKSCLMNRIIETGS